MKKSFNSRKALLTSLFLLLCCIATSLLSFSHASGGTPDFNTTGQFPSGFLFGVATASHQVEGNNNKNDWWIFEQSVDVADSGEAVRHRDLTQLGKDLDLAKNLGINSYRLSIEWSRVEPTQDNFIQSEIDYYKQVIDMIRARGMIPIVGLHHFTLPNWLLDPNDPANKPGWVSNDIGILQQFNDYVVRMAQELGSRVDYWTTFNEPTGQIGGGYLAGIWSPGRGLIPEWGNYVAAINNMIAAHRSAYSVIKLYDTIDADGDSRPALVGAVQNIKPIYPHTAGTDDDQDARDWDYVLQKQFLDAIAPVYDVGEFIIPGYAFPSREYGYNCWDTDFDYSCDMPSTQNSYLDFIGLNYYNAASSIGHVAGLQNWSLGDKNTGGIQSSVLMTYSRMGRPASDFSEEVYSGGPWEIYPEGLLYVLRDLWGRYKLPVLITENGLAETGEKGQDCNISNRPQYIISHLQMILQAISEGIPVLGYMHWSLLDNFEWREAYDTRTKFGLYHVTLNEEKLSGVYFGPSGNLGPVENKELNSMVSGYQDRHPTPGADAYNQIAHANAITSRILNRWGSFYHILGDTTVQSDVHTINAGYEIPPDYRMWGTEIFDDFNINPGCRIIDIDLMFTDGSGNPEQQDLNLHQGGRVAYSHLQALNKRAWISNSNPGTNIGRVEVEWSRDAPGSPRIDFRVLYHLDCWGSDIDSDGIISTCDNCPTISNADQTDSDGDKWGNACDDNGSDNDPPRINNLIVSPKSLSIGDSVNIFWEVSDTGGAGLNKVFLRRANDNDGTPGTWIELNNTLASGNGPVSGTFYDAPPSIGVYWYGLLVTDMVGNVVFELQPIKVIVLSLSDYIYIDKANVWCAFPNGNMYCDVVYGGPYLKIIDGVNAATPGERLFIKTGSYNEKMTIKKALQINSWNGPVTIGQ